MNLPERFYTATVVAHPGEPAAKDGVVIVGVSVPGPSEWSDTPWMDYYQIDAKTAFMGAVEDEAAFKSLKPDMRVNIWVSGGHVDYASPIYR